MAKNRTTEITTVINKKMSSIFITRLSGERDYASVIGNNRNYSPAHAATRARRMAFAALYFVLLQQAKP